MRSQPSSIGQNSGTSDQKKSVFDRLGRQLDTGRKMKRRPSPGQHGAGEYMPLPPPLHDVDYGRYGRDPHQAEMEWRYQQERRHMPPFARGDRGHPMQLAPPPPQPPPPGHYEMEMERGQGPYYPPHPHPYHNGPHAPLPPGMGPANMGPMNMPPQRTSPKYDRHGNLIVGFKGDRLMRMGPMEHHHAMSPPRNFMPGPMLGPMHPSHEMSPMSFPHQRWPDNMEPDFPSHPGGRMMPMDGGFNPLLDSRRYPNQPPPQQQQQIMNALPPPGHPGGEFPRYTKWRERRDVITNLDRETAQSSSRTDSLKSTLQQAQQQDSRNASRNDPSNNHSSSHKVKSSRMNQKSPAKSELIEKGSSNSKDKTKPAIKTDPQDISDGEIVDDEDSSDESETNDRLEAEKHDILLGDESYLNHQSNRSSMGPYGRNRDSHQYYEPVKKRRLLDRDDYSMDYETISDEDLDDFMEDKKLSPSEVKLAGRLGEGERKSLSEIELLNALGLDWANLVEMARQSKSSGKESSAPGTALTRFSLSNYLPTLGISSSLVGPEIYELITRVCRI